MRVLFQSSDGQVWCGTNRGLFVRAAGADWRQVAGPGNRAIYAIAENSDGLLVGSANGLYVLDKQTPATSDQLRASRIAQADTAADETDEEEGRPPDSVRAISQFQGATYIAAYNRGLERLELRDGALERTLVWPPDTGEVSAAEREVVSLHADRNGKLWIGTAGAGVFFFDGEKITADPALAKLGGDATAVWSIAEGRDGSFWLATERGLFRYREGTLEEIVPGLDTRSVLVGDAPATGSSPPQVWCATAGGGLLRVSLDDQFNIMLARLDVEQGLPSQNAFALLMQGTKEGDESLLIGTSRGLTWYEPGHVAPRLSATRITGSRAYQPEELQKGLRLEYPQNSLAIDVAATSSRTFPEQFQYAFLLSDGAGRVIKRRLSHDSQFLIQNLRPGKYQVAARAYSIDLIASSPLTFNLDVARPPFPWTTLALSVLLTLALVALAWGAVQNRKIARAGAALARANRELASTRMQLANETETERRRIARDLHDQTLADLRRLLLMADQLPADNAGPRTVEGDEQPLDRSMLRAEIEAISKEIRRICEDLSPSVLENVGLAAALEWALADAVAHLPARRKFTYEFSCDEGLEERVHFTVLTQLQIYRIVQEAINNICRHAAATHVWLTVGLAPNNDFVLSLEDNGHGFDTRGKKSAAGRGLANIRARAMLIEAEVGWRKREEGGIIFTLRKHNNAADGFRPGKSIGRQHVS